jgi:outer membrane protein assembly factor BamB
VVSRGTGVVALTYAEVPAHSALYDLTGAQTANLVGGRIRSLSADGTALVVDSALRRVSASGADLWQTARLRPDGTTEGAEIAEASDGSVVVLASAASATGYYIFPDGRAECFDSLTPSLAAKYTASGSQLWAAPLPNACHRALLGIGADGTVYTGVFAHDALIHVAALDGATGGERWTTVVNAPAVYPPLAVAPDGTVLIRTTQGALVALSAADGSVRWTLNDVYSGTAVDGSGTVYVLGRPAPSVTELRAHALSSGALLWSTVLDTATQSSNTNFAVAADGTVYWASRYTVMRIGGPDHVVTVMHEDPRSVTWGPFFDDAGNVVELFADGRMVAWPSAGPSPGWPTPRGDARGTRRVSP